MTDQIRASHILLMYEGSERSTATRSKEDALTRIQELKTELAAGGDFAEIAEGNSDCPSGGQGGDLGFFGPGMMVPEFDKVVFSADVNSVEGPVQTHFGYHLLEVTSRTD